MKTKILFIFLIASAILLNTSCIDEEDKQDNKLTGFLNKADLYIFKNGEDSVIIKCSGYYYYSINYSFYKKNNNGLYDYKESIFFGASNLKFGKDRYGRFFTNDSSIKLYYEIKGNNLLLHHFHDLGTIELYPTREELKFIYEPLLKGVWCEVMELDSTITVFEDSKLKQYVFLRNTKEIINTLYSNSYSTRQNHYYWKDEVFTNPSAYIYYQHPDSTTYHNEKVIYRLHNKDSLTIGSSTAPLRGGNFKRVK